jgi:hypothetical protein
MPFIEELQKYGSLSIVGLEKNTGKTECLNYILNRLPLDKIRVGVSSIGIDGEKQDQVTGSSKPEIILDEGVYFTTAESFYKRRKLLSEILSISDEYTSSGRLVTARVRARGKVMLAGPPTTSSLIDWKKMLKDDHQVDLTIIDGALSRLSPASPAVSESMILTTGASLTLNKELLVKKTKFISSLIDIELTNIQVPSGVKFSERGVWGVDPSDGSYMLLFDSAFQSNEMDKNQYGLFSIFFVSGVLTDRLLKRLSGSNNTGLSTEIITRDFSKLFITERTLNYFKESGGKISVLSKSKLLAVCVNPVSPNGYMLDSADLCESLREQIYVPVIDVFNDNYVQ